MAEEVLKGQQCPMCGKKTLTLTEADSEVPYFGKIFLFSMKCSSCHYYKADVEAATQQEPCKCTLDVTDKKDLNARVIRSAEGTVKIPHIGTMEPGPAANGFITNVEGVLQRFKEQIESLRDNAEDDGDRKKAKNMLKKLQKVMWGSEKIKIVIEDPTGNSAIISDKAKREKVSKRGKKN
ncbi:ZPR1 zinc finger domain-containing protein [Candidatus Woesearchaeota archaeon]|nr:ZPR1 zinc finger domain-containing protein [Candidatus Woesearchaeota archaeon]